VHNIVLLYFNKLVDINIYHLDQLIKIAHRLYKFTIVVCKQKSELTDTKYNA